MTPGMPSTRPLTFRGVGEGLKGWEGGVGLRWSTNRDRNISEIMLLGDKKLCTDEFFGTCFFVCRVLYAADVSNKPAVCSKELW